MTVAVAIAAIGIGAVGSRFVPLAQNASHASNDGHGASAPAAAPAPAPAAGDVHGAAPGGPTVTPAAVGTTILLDPIVTNIQTGAEEEARFVKVTAQLDVGTSPENKEAVEASIVAIRHHFLMRLSALTANDATGAENRTRIQADLLRLANESLGAPRVFRVYFAEFVVQ